MMRDYRKMSPCERVTYYRQKICQLSPPKSSRDVLLIETLQRLVEENVPPCGGKVSMPLPQKEQ